MLHTSETFEVNDFLKHRTILNCPTENEIFAGYAHLPPAGQIEISCALTDVPSVLRTLEAAAFFGITIQSCRELARGAKILAFKGKEGPCFNSGKSAIYCGGALAVLDDDHHLLFGEMRICEKTATIYSLPVYKKQVKITGSNPELLSRLASNPVTFDCDTFEADVARLASSLCDLRAHEQPSSAILYPGPFNTLILRNGAIIWRGVPAKIADKTARELARSDGCMQLQGEMAEQAEMPLNFKREYGKHGALCLLEKPEARTVFESRSQADLSILDETPEEMKQRLLKMIASKSEYFIMTGSDARDVHGCCPSDGVKAANLLVEAGVLQVARTENAPDACPVNIYAFAGEIRSRNDQPEFAPDLPFREKIQNYIQKGRNPANAAWVQVLRWSLLLFAALSLGVMVANIVTQCNEGERGYSESEFIEALKLPFQSGVAVVQFHRAQRCTFCNNMEVHTRGALDRYFLEEMQAGTLAFRLANMDLPRHQMQVQKFGLFTSSAILIELQEQRIVRWKVFADAWDLTDREQEFMEKFRTELVQFREGDQR